MPQQHLPDELLVTDAIQRDLRDILFQAYDLLEFGVHLPEQRDVHAGSFPRDGVVTAIALFSKLTLTFRGIILLCEHGLDRPAQGLSRTLFEGFMNLTFLLRRRVSLHCFSSGKRTPHELYGKRLTPDFRTALFNAWSMLRTEHEVNQWSTTPNIKRQGRKAAAKLALMERPYVDAIGPEWKKAIKKSNTCVGLSIANFAASLGTPFGTWYRTVYAGESSFIHQSDTVDYLAPAGSGDFHVRWFTSPDRVVRTLERASVLYVGCVCELNKRFRFGTVANERIRKFAQTFHPKADPE